MSVLCSWWLSASAVAPSACWQQHLGWAGLSREAVLLLRSAGCCTLGADLSAPEAGRPGSQGARSPWPVPQVWLRLDPLEGMCAPKCLPLLCASWPWEERESWIIGCPKEETLVERGLEKFLPTSKGGRWYLPVIRRACPWGAGCMHACSTCDLAGAPREQRGCLRRSHGTRCPSCGVLPGAGGGKRQRQNWGRIGAGADILPFF